MKNSLLFIVLQVIILSGLFAQQSDCSRQYSVNVLGDTVVKDIHGNTLEVISRDIFGNRVVKDAHGNCIASYEKDIFGNTVVKDGSGRRVASYEKDILTTPKIIVSMM